MVISHFNVRLTRPSGLNPQNPQNPRVREASPGGLPGQRPRAEEKEVRTQICLEDPGTLVSKVISTLIGVISNYKYSYLIYNPSY